MSAWALGKDKAPGLKGRLACQGHTGAEAAAIALGGPLPWEDHAFGGRGRK